MENQDAKKQETSVDFKSSAKNILNKVDEVSRPLGVMAWGLGELAAAKLAKLISKLIKAVKPLPGYVKELAEKWYLLLKKSVITPAKEDLQVLKNRVMVIVDGYKVSRETGNAEVKTAIARMKPYA